ncbi:Lysophospholipase [Lachnellula hyalina]|uniref:Lysophospholipase n=1 Tax=Lachnellula hyalina TaxID=1316788 RepID=A0A8H8U3T3_9HELO|nr:Lysophospholipase [Lachnellula hyalina]TVY30354.1 Lysophospholipase [Lachnellula hyalina]
MFAATGILSLLLSTVLVPAALADSSSYVPISATCPSESLVRAASGLSTNEEAYRVSRKAVADEALKSWLAETNSEFNTDELPTIALSSSGGGDRALLSGAGVIQGLDARDSNVSTSGLFQALTYHSGLSGGAWLLTSFAGNNYPTISSLESNLWGLAIQDSLLDPELLGALIDYLTIADEVEAKESAGFETTLIDVYGRLLGYQLYGEPDGGAGLTLSSITGFSNFTSHAVPYPIITALGAKVWLGECTPGPNGTTYEFTPFEFGSWDSDVSAFTQTKYLGTSMKGGSPVSSCTINYDNIGYIAGTSSDVFASELCTEISDSSELVTELEKILVDVHEIATSDQYATYRNPFYEYQSSTQVPNSANNISAQQSLSLVDGGVALQNNPIFPLLQPARQIDVIIVNDNSADTSNNWPNGSEILTTYVQSFNHNLTRMPYIPPVATFIAEGLNTRATFFGCNDSSKVTIVYLPNADFTFSSNVPTAQLAYSKAEQADMIANGVQIVSQGEKAGWGTCLGCALMMKTNQTLPDDCTACFADYCYYE